MVDIILFPHPVSVCVRYHMKDTKRPKEKKRKLTIAERWLSSTRTILASSVRMTLRPSVSLSTLLWIVSDSTCKNSAERE